MSLSAPEFSNASNSPILRMEKQADPGDGLNSGPWPVLEGSISQGTGTQLIARMTAVTTDTANRQAQHSLTRMDYHLNMMGDATMQHARKDKSNRNEV